MFDRKKFLALALSSAVGLSATLAQAQVFTDDDFLAADYTTSGIGTIQDIDFNVDYSAIDVFGDGFLTASLPEAPNSSGGAATTGVFMTVNNDSIALGGSGVESFASISPTLANVNVGLGTATPNYVMQVDVFHSTGPGTDDGAGNLDFTGTTNYSYLGINQTNTTVRIQENNASATTGQGVGLAITADTGAAEDFLPHYGGAGYRFREGIGPNVAGDGTNFRSGQSDNPDLRTGLVGDVINDAWVAETGAASGGQDFAFGTGVPETELNQFSGNSLFFSPDPNDPESFISDGSGVDRSYYAEAFPVHDDPLVITASLTPPAFAIGNDFGTAGVPYNRWATHRLYYIDETFTYTIEDSVSGVEVVVLEKLINDPTDAGDDTVFDDTSDAGSVVLGFWDRFGGSIALSPEGANFVVYDNLSVSAASAGDAPTLSAAVADFLPGATGTPGDEDGDGDVDGADFLALQRNNPAGIADWLAAYPAAAPVAAASVPEPSTAVLLVGLAAGLISRRRS